MDLVIMICLILIVFNIPAIYLIWALYSYEKEIKKEEKYKKHLLEKINSHYRFLIK